MTSWISNADRVSVSTRYGDLPCAISADLRPGGPVVLLVHGRNGRADQVQMLDLAQAYLARGWSVVAPDLPFSVASPDLGPATQATMAHHFQAAAEVLAWLEERLPSDAPLALCGHSLGAYVIARLSETRPGLHHLCAVSPVVSGQHLIDARIAMGGDALAILAAEVPQMYATMARDSCAAALAATDTPVAVMTGSADGLTPPAHARAYFDAAKNPRFFSLLPDLHHCPDGPLLARAMAAALDAVGA